MTSKKRIGRIIAPIAALAMMAALATGCGGGGGSSAAQSSSNLKLRIELPRDAMQEGEESYDHAFDALINVTSYDATGAPTTVASTTSTLTYNETTEKVTGTFFITQIPVGSNYVVAAHVTMSDSRGERIAAEGDVESQQMVLHIGGLVDAIQDGVTSEVTLNFESHIETLALMCFAKNRGVALSDTSEATDEVKAAIASTIDEMFAEAPPEELMMMMYFLMMEEFTGGDPYDPSNWTSEFESFLVSIVTAAGYHQGPSGPGVVSGRVYDAVSGLPLDGVTVSIGGQSILSNELGIFSAEISAGEHFYTISKEDYITAEARIVSSNQAEVSAGTINLVPETHSGAGSACGTVFNALDNSAMENIAVNLIDGVNYLTGTSVISDVSDETGLYCLNEIPAGNYTAVFSSETIITSYMNIVVVGGQVRTENNQSVTPLLGGGGDYRFVLTWGEYPDDLDSHMHIPLNGGESYYHVYHGDVGSGIIEPMTLLDRDDTDSYGPETITIVEQHEQGTYVYYINNFSDSGDTSSSILSSGAKVDVYSGDSLLGSFNVPSSGVGPIWMVCALDGNILTPINQIGTYADFSDLIPDDGYFGGEGELRIIAKKTK